MKLTDKEYLILASFADAVHNDTLTGLTLRELLQQDGGESNADIEGVPTGRGLFELKLAAKWNAPDAVGYAFTNENDDKWIIFAYKPDALLENLKTLLSGENPLMQQAAQFVHANRGSADCYVTGFGLGGALAMYASGLVEGIQGVVFDAPGIGQLSEAQEPSQAGIRNFLAYNSLVSALGIHSEPVQFAGPAGSTSGDLLLGQADRQWYKTESGGGIITGDPGEAFELLSKLNILFEEGERVDEVSDVFLRAAGLQDSGASELIHAVLPLSERMELGSMREALADIAGHYDRHVQEIWSKWKKDMTGYARKQGHDELVAVFAEQSESAMLEASALLEELYRITEAFLIVLILYGQGESRLPVLLEELLGSLTEPMIARLERLSMQMTAELDGLMEMSLNSAFMWPELDFDFKEEGP